MKVWQPVSNRYRIALALTLVVATIGGGVYATTDTASAQMQLDGLDVSNIDKTVSGDVSAVHLSTRLNYEYDVPDAERRIVKLMVGTSESNLELINYVQDREPSGSDSGTVELTGDILEHPQLSAETFDPALADTKQTEVVIRAIIEIQRANGETVTKQVTDTATITLTDDAELTATVGGTGTIAVSTA